MVFAVLLISTTSAHAEFTPCKQQQCIAVVDAGSTGSRLHIYAYDLDESNSPININELWNNKVTPGFATIAANTNTINVYLNDLFSGAPEHQMPVYFYATAGMRLVALPKQAKYYGELRNWFAKQNQWQLADAKTITGKDEALFDWLSVNYQLGTLQNTEKGTVGVMDMGGASVQIVFPLQKQSDINTKSQATIELYGHKINLYVQSFLGLGQTEVLHQFLNSSYCFVNNYILPDGGMGQGNASACTQEVSSLINEVHKVSNQIQPLITANPVDSWYTLGGINNLVDNSLFQFDNNQMTSQQLLQQANSQICNQQWDNLNEQFPSDEYVYQYCLLSAYYYALMVNGYGLSPEQTVHYFTPQNDLGWSLGVVLHH